MKRGLPSSGIRICSTAAHSIVLTCDWSTASVGIGIRACIRWAGRQCAGVSGAEIVKSMAQPRAAAAGEDDEKRMGAALAHQHVPSVVC